MAKIEDFKPMDEIYTTFGIFVVCVVDKKEKTLLVKKLSDILDEMAKDDAP